jgi:uncharacterized membrane protein YdjX (TVP38/TMEM64 family)
MVRDLVAFAALALWCNTAAGPPFDPVLLLYAGRHAFPGAWVLIVVGSLCAGAGAALEAGLLRVGGTSRATRVPRRFYAMAFLIAASPMPFTLARAAAALHRPRAWPYALAVAAGRVPRYLATIALWTALSPPAWIVPVGGALGVATAALPFLLRRWRRSPVAAARDTVAAA